MHRRISIPHRTSIRPTTNSRTTYTIVSKPHFFSSQQFTSRATKTRLQSTSSVVKGIEGDRTSVENENKPGGETVTRNEVGVQLLPSSLRAQIFGRSPSSNLQFTPPEKEVIKVSKNHLMMHGLLPKELMEEIRMEGKGAEETNEGVKGKKRAKKGSKPVESESPSPSVNPTSASASTSASSLSKPLPDPKLELPPLKGETIDEHFHNIGIFTSHPYLSLAREFAGMDKDESKSKGEEEPSSNNAHRPLDMPPAPTTWSLNPGWTCYYPDGSSQPVDFPDPKDSTLVLDIETVPSLSQFPVVACAVGKDNWYAWVSPWLLGKSETDEHLIPLPTSELRSNDPNDLDRDAKSSNGERQPPKHRLIIGHNVGYDRARLEDEYSLTRSGNRFLDTMSLHIAAHGLTADQRMLWIKHRRNKQQNKEQEDLTDDFPRVKSSSGSEGWLDVASANSLKDVAFLHCGIKLDKSFRDEFLASGSSNAHTLENLKSELPHILKYCAKDVWATLAVYRIVFPQFLKRCPSPASFSGLLHMGNSFLPVDENWEKYVRDAEEKYGELVSGVKTKLDGLAEEARELMHVKASEKNGNDAKGKGKGKEKEVWSDGKWVQWEWEKDPWLRQLDWTPKKIKKIKAKAQEEVIQDDDEQAEVQRVPTWRHQLERLGETKSAFLNDPVVPLLLNMSWRGYPVTHFLYHGWTFLVPVSETQFQPAEYEKPLSIALDDLKPTDRKSFRQLVDRDEEFKFYSVPGSQKGKKRRSLITKPMSAIADGLLSSSVIGPRLLLDVVRGKPDSLEEVMEKVRAVADDVMNMEWNDVKANRWFRQLNWEPSSPDNNESTSSSKSEAKPTFEDLTPEQVRENYWPKWYWELVRAKDGGLDLTTRTKITPLLLKLRWRGYPLFRSKQHGWCYRVPHSEVEKVLQSQGMRSRSSPAGQPLVFLDPKDENLLEDTSGTYFKIPHHDGDDLNVGSPLSKPFVTAFEDGRLTSAYPDAREALDMNAQCSYWISSRERVMGQFVLWKTKDGKWSGSRPPAAVSSSNETVTTSDDGRASSSRGLILPQVQVMGTVTRRAVEKTWLTASNAKKNRVGSELKSMVRAPPGYSIVGADVDSEELWICSVMGDAQFGIHGATALGWMTLEGTKSTGTDMHSKTASILGITRDGAKVFNYSRLYGAGIKHAVQLLLKGNSSLAQDVAVKQAEDLYASTKGLKRGYNKLNEGRSFWHGGTESYVFNVLEKIASSENPKTPALGCGITLALSKAHAGQDFMTSRINWVVQSSGVDYLHMLIVAMEYLMKTFEIRGRFMISVHDEIRYLVEDQDRHRAALALQIANVWTRSQFAFRLQMDDLPQGCAFFSAVDVDHVLRKEVNMPCITPSHPTPIPPGECLDIYQTLEHTSQGSLFSDGRPTSFESESTIQDDENFQEVLQDCHRRNRNGTSKYKWEDRTYREKDKNFLTAQAFNNSIDIHRLSFAPTKRNNKTRNLFRKNSPSGLTSTSSKTTKRDYEQGLQPPQYLEDFERSDDDVFAPDHGFESDGVSDLGFFSGEGEKAGGLLEASQDSVKT